MEDQPTQEKKSNKTILIVVIIVVIIGAAAGIYFFTQGDDESTNTNMNTSQVNTTTSASPVNSDSDVSVVDYAIEMDEYSYSPASIQVESGETIQIKLTNTGNMVHDFVIDELNVNSGLLSPGEEKTITITGSDAGSYSFYCSVGRHRQLGMEGVITVQ